MLPIFVPSYGRAGDVRSMRWLGADRELVFVVPERQVDEYRAAHPRQQVLGHPASMDKHMGRVRAWIMNEAARGQPHFQIDDDISLRLISATSVDDMLKTIEGHLQHVPMAGLGQQLFSNHAIAAATRTGSLGEDRGEPVLRNKFVATVYAVDPARVGDAPMENLPVYEDVAMVIRAIERGGTVVSYCATHTNVSPPAGGCNSWRDSEVTLASLRELVRLWPDYCKEAPTKNTTHSQQIGVGLRTSWSRIRRLP